MIKNGDIRATIVQRRKRSINKVLIEEIDLELDPGERLELVLQGEEAGGHSR